MNATPKYAGWSIIDIEDSRSRDEHGKIVPGSGDARACDCCGKTIYVHVHICTTKRSTRCVQGQQEPVLELQDDRAIVGRDCSRKACCADIRSLRIKFVRRVVTTSPTSTGFATA